jgi:thymidylate kinase
MRPNNDLRKIVVAIEGVDGAGKTSLAHYIQELCRQRGLSCALIGRRTGQVTPTIVKLTRLLREEVSNLAPHADIFVRLAREYQRAHLASCSPPGIVVLDRFVLTVLSMARIYGHEIDALLPQFREIVARADLHATVFVHCPFETAWARVQERNQGLTPARSRGEKLLRRVADFLAADFERGLVTGQQWLVDNSGDLHDAEEQVANYLRPYLPQAPEPEPVAAESPAAETVLAADQSEFSPQ